MSVCVQGLEPQAAVFRINGKAYEVDFENGDVLDCRRANLKLVAHGQASIAKRSAPGFACLRVNGEAWYVHDLIMKKILDQAAEDQALSS